MTRRGAWALLSVVVATSTASCAKKAGPAAGLEVVIATNLSAPSQYDTVEIQVSQETGPGASKTVLDKTTMVPGQTTLPTTLAIEPGTAPDQTALVVVTASLAGAPVVVRKAEVVVPHDRVAELPMVLSSVCGFVTCSDPSESCDPSTGTCASDAVDSAGLATYQPGDADRIDAGPADAALPMPDGARDATATDASEAGKTSDAPPESCPTYFVAMTGKSSNSGCSGEAPLPTIATALAAAKASGGAPATVDVCAGTYTETSLVVDFPVTLLGGFDCSTPSAWTRPTDEGYASFSASPSIIENGSVTMQQATLVVTAADAGPSPTIDGFTIYAATTNGGVFTDPSVNVTSVNCAGATRVTLSSNVLVPDPAPGGGFHVSGTSSLAARGVFLLDGASPTLSSNMIAAGLSVGTNSVGVQSDGSPSTVTLRNNVISGGAGPSASYGLFLPGPSQDGGTIASYVISGNVIHGGSGQTSYGVVIENTTCTLDGNFVDTAPTGADAGVQCGNAVQIEGAGQVVLTQNRVYGGVCEHAAVPNNAVYLGSLTAPEVYNNMISGGSLVHGGSDSYALRLSGVTGADVRFNTLVGGVSVDEPNGASSGLTIALSVESGSVGTTIRDNVLVGVASGDAGVGLNLGCRAGDAGPAITSFENNAVMNAPLALLRTANCLGPSRVYTMKGTTNELIVASDAAVGDANVFVGPSCVDAGSNCVPDPTCVSPSTCLTGVFAGWDTTSYGAANLFAKFDGDAGCTPPAGSGWTLSTSAPCAISRGGAVDPSIGQDLYGGCRNTATGKPTSMGADESSAQSCQTVP